MGKDIIYYAIRRMLYIIPSFFLLTIVIFIFLYLMPHQILESERFSTYYAATPSQLNHASLVMGFGLPIPVEYLYFLKTLLLGRWGYSLITFGANRSLVVYYGGTVTNALSIFLPYSITLLLISLTIVILMAIPVAIRSGMKPYTMGSNLERLFSLVTYSFPVFFTSLLLQYLFGKGVINGNPFGIFPVTGVGIDSTLIKLQSTSWRSWIIFGNNTVPVTYPTHFILLDSLIHGNMILFDALVMHLILPITALVLGSLAIVIRIIRSSVGATRNEVYVSTARAKGVPEKRIIRDHIRKNAMMISIPSFTFLIPTMIGGLVVVEIIFGYYGIALFFAYCILQDQVYGVFYVIFVLALISLIANVVIDIIYASINPRIKRKMR